MARVEELIIEMFRATWGASLRDLVEPLSASSAVVESTAHLRAGDGAARLGALVPDALAPAITRELAAWLWARNQFLELDAAARSELERSVVRALQRLRDPSEVAAALAAHRAELAAFVRARLGHAPREVVCAEYSPALQLELLGITVPTLLAPVLDVGCGPGAALVRFLRAQGVAAEGLDRLAPAQAGRAGDWLTHPYGNARWGTVLSHLGFSLHFLHYHQAPGDRAYAYARAYMAILRSLRLGGRFAYTPSLPFIEALLDARVYRVQRAPFASELRVRALRSIEDETGLELGAASHVQRIV